MKACGLPVKGAIHLVRDPRAYVASAKRVGVSIDSAVQSWVKAHTMIETTTRRAGENVMRIRYEDFCDRPSDFLDALQKWMGLSAEPLLRKPRKHLHWLGNASLLSFAGEIRASERWREELSKPELDRIYRAAGPTAGQYGYDLAPL